MSGEPEIEGNRERGRPTKYDPSFVRIAAVMARHGATEFEIAQELGVDRVTLWRWKSEHEDFCNAIKADKAAADDRVEASLFHRAVGYSHDAVKIVVVDKEVHREEYIEHYPPDTAAAFIWLKNRRPEAWRERKEERTPEQDAAIKTTAQKLRAALEELEALTDAPGSDTPAE